MFLEHNSNIMIEFQVLLCFENIMLRRFGEKARYSPIKVWRILALITDYFFLRAKSGTGLCPVDVLEGESRLLAGLCGDDWDVLASSCLAAVGCEIPTSAGHHQESKICRRTLSCGFCFTCDSVGIRTQDPQLRRLLLYPAELPNQSIPFELCSLGMQR